MSDRLESAASSSVDPNFRNILRIPRENRTFLCVTCRHTVPTRFIGIRGTSDVCRLANSCRRLLMQIAEAAWAVMRMHQSEHPSRISHSLRAM